MHSFKSVVQHPLKLNLSKVFAIFFTIILVLIATFRGDTSDSHGYALLYESMKDADIFINPFKFYLLYGVEWTFGLASTLLGNLNFSYRALFFTYSLLSFLLLHEICKKIEVSYNIFLLFYIGYYFITQQLTFMRYGFAVIMAYYFYVLAAQERMNIAKYTLVLLVLSQVHLFVSISFLCMIFIRNFHTPVNSVLTVRYALRFTAISIFGLVLAKYTLDILPSEKVIFYLENEEIGSYINFLSIENLKSVFLLILFSFVLFGRSVLPELRSLYLVYLLSVVVRFVFYDIGVLSSRVGYIFGFSEIFIIIIILTKYIRFRFGQFLVGLLYVFLHRFFTQTYSTSELFDLYMTPIN